MPTILLRYGEIALKSPKVRSRFQKHLIRNIEDQFLLHNLECIVKSEWGRIFLHTPDFEKASSILKHIFGVISFSEVQEVDAEMNSMKNAAIEFSSNLFHLL